MTLKLNGSSSGYTAIDAPASAGSNTLTLPVNNGSSGQFLQTNGSGAMSWANAGLVLQVVTATTTTQSTASNQSWDIVAAPQPVITPSSSSNKVLVLVSAPGIARNTSNFGQRLERVIGGTAATVADQWYENSADVWSPVNFNMIHLDSPNTTSATTYRVSIWSHQNASNCRWAYDAGSGNVSTGTITLVEIKA